MDLLFVFVFERELLFPRAVDGRLVVCWMRAW